MAFAKKLINKRFLTTACKTKKEGKTAYEQLVGNTRLIRLAGPSELTGCDIYGKCEWENPGSSIKDRAALWMVKDAEKKKTLVRGESGLIIEGTAGNTGIGLALCGKAFGYDVIICLADTQSPEKKDALRQAGALLLEMPAVPFKDQNNYVHVAERLSDAIKERGLYEHVFYANQWDNLSNRQAHIDGTGPEIWEQTGGKIDAFSCATGTGGTITGVGTYLRTMNKDIKIALTDPEGAAVLRYFTEGTLRSVGSSISEGIGQGRITGNMGAGNFTPDMFFEISDQEMMPILQNLQETEGLAIGGSAGINVAGAIKVAQELGPGHTIVTVLCDRADRYATKLYNREFLNSRGLPVPMSIDDGHNNDIMKIATSLLEETVMQ
jgi:cysteine synthase